MVVGIVLLLVMMMMGITTEDGGASKILKYDGILYQSKDICGDELERTPII